MMQVTTIHNCKPLMDKNLVHLKQRFRFNECVYYRVNYKLVNICKKYKKSLPGRGEFRSVDWLYLTFWIMINIIIIIIIICILWPTCVYIARRQANIYDSALPRFKYSWTFFSTAQFAITVNKCKRSGPTMHAKHHFSPLLCSVKTPF